MCHSTANRYTQHQVFMTSSQTILQHHLQIEIKAPNRLKGHIGAIVRASFLKLLFLLPI